MFDPWFSSCNWALPWVYLKLLCATGYSGIGTLFICSQHFHWYCMWSEIALRDITLMFQLMDAVMLQLTRARNRLTTPASMTLPELAASGLMVSGGPSLHLNVDSPCALVNISPVLSRKCSHLQCLVTWWWTSISISVNCVWQCINFTYCSLTLLRYQAISTK